MNYKVTVNRKVNTAQSIFEETSMEFENCTGVPPMQDDWLIIHQDRTMTAIPVYDIAFYSWEKM